MCQSVQMQDETCHPAAKYKAVFIGVGVVHILFSIVCFILGIAIAIDGVNTTKYHAGIWGGILNCICGGLTISIGIKALECKVTTGLIVAIIMSLVALVCGVLDAIGASEANGRSGNPNNQDNIRAGYRENALKITISAVFHFIQMIFAVVVFVFCCKSNREYDQETVAKKNNSNPTSIAIVEQDQRNSYKQPAGATVITNINAQQHITIANSSVPNVLQNQGQAVDQTNYLPPIQTLPKRNDKYNLPPPPDPKVHTNLAVHQQMAISRSPAPNDYDEHIYMEYEEDHLPVKVAAKNTNTLTVHQDQQDTYEQPLGVSVITNIDTQQITSTPQSTTEIQNKVQGKAVDANPYLTPIQDQKQDFTMLHVAKDHARVAKNRKGNVEDTNTYIVPIPTEEQEQEYVELSVDQVRTNIASKQHIPPPTGVPHQGKVAHTYTPMEPIPAEQKVQEQEYVMLPFDQVQTNVATKQHITTQNLPKISTGLQHRGKVVKTNAQAKLVSTEPPRAQEQEYDEVPLEQVQTSIANKRQMSPVKLVTPVGVQNQAQVADENAYVMSITTTQQGQEQDYIVPPDVKTNIDLQKRMAIPSFPAPTDDKEHEYLDFEQLQLPNP